MPQNNFVFNLLKNHSLYSFDFFPPTFFKQPFLAHELYKNRWSAVRPQSSASTPGWSQSLQLLLHRQTRVGSTQHSTGTPESSHSSACIRSVRVLLWHQVQLGQPGAGSQVLTLPSPRPTLLTQSAKTSTGEAF